VAAAQIVAMCRLKFGGLMPKESKLSLEQQAKTLSPRDFCYAVLNKVRCVCAHSHALIALALLLLASQPPRSGLSRSALRRSQSLMCSLYSRSFAVVIAQLPEELRDCVCIFYLALRGLDSVGEQSFRVPLRCFSQTRTGSTGSLADLRFANVRNQSPPSIHALLLLPFFCQPRSETDSNSCCSSCFAQRTT
jgi:hypothetical protein